MWTLLSNEHRRFRGRCYTPAESALLPAVLMPGTLDLATFRRALEIFAEELRRHREEIDSLNVYPVPDGDTGTNLLMTQEAVVAALATTASCVINRLVPVSP